MTEKKLNYIRIKILNGKYKDARAQFDVRNRNIDIQSLDIIENEEGEKEYRIITIQEKQFKKVERAIHKVDNAMKIALIFASVITLGVTFYRLETGYNYYGVMEFVIEFVFSAVSGAVWGGIIYFIAKFFKSNVNVIRIITNTNEVIDILDEPVINMYLLQPSQSESANSSDVKKYSINKKEESFNEKYDELIKLDTLLKKGIINNSEFEAEKNKILSKK